MAIEMFNLDELKQDWEEEFYESGWHTDTMSLTDTESKIINELTDFLPRHMEVYDWNLPYAEEVVLIVRRAIAAAVLATEKV